MKFFLILVLTFNCALLKSETKILPSEFDYQTISKYYFETGIDEPFPLTVQKGNNLYSSISKDNRYLFFASDFNGNFDIYLRDLRSSIQVPITFHPSSDTKPAISPDGKKLIFVSERNNTNKDLFLIELDPADYIKEYTNGNKIQLTENLLLDKKNTKDDFNDTDPIWSPDSKKIYFISDRLSPGVFNILSFNLNNSELKLITRGGGNSPRISEDGRFLTYISYKDNSFGEIYLLEIEKNLEKRITNDNYINTSPSISETGEFIYYTIIRRDSNKNGKLDLNDNSLIARIDVKTGESKNLTSDNFSIFDTKITNFNKGSIIFSASLNNSIDIYFIPSEGLISKRNTILEQFNFATRMKRKENTDTFFLALDAINLYFQNDILYPIIQSRVLDVKAEELKFRNQKFELKIVLEELKNLKNKNLWESGYGFYLKQISNEKNYAKNILEYYNTLINSANKENLAALLYLASEDLEDRNQNEEVKKIYRKILYEYKDFYRIKDVERKLAKLEFKQNINSIPEGFFELLNEENLPVRERRKVLQDIEQIINEKIYPKERINFLNQLIVKYSKEKSKRVFDLLNFLKADNLNKNRKFEESNQVLDSFLETIPAEPIDCRTNPFCKKPILCENNPTCMKSHILKSKNFRSLGSPSKSFEELRIILENFDPELGVELEKSEVERSFKYFENKAAEYESRGDFKQTAFNYFFNAENMYLLKYKNLFVKDLYKDYAVYYQKKMVDSILRYALKQADDERNELLNRLNLLGKENLNILGRISSVLSSITDATKLSIIFGDIKDLENNDDVLGKPGSPDDALRILDQHFNLNRPRSRPVLYLASLYGYAYYLINKAMIYDEHYKKEKSYTRIKREQILRDLKNAENELKWIIYSDPLYSDAYQLLGWLYQYIGLARLEFKEDKKIFDKYFSDKNFEENIYLYTQILDFLGEIENKKILSDLNLNLANNYHLIKKYSKANEHYEKVEKLSKGIKTNVQFENYKQEAIYYFHYGRLLFSQKNFSKAIQNFTHSTDIYYKNEFDNKTKNNEKNKIKYEVHDKLVLLHTYLSICYSENFDYVSSINNLKKALALNYNSEILDNIVIYSLLAYNYQKVEKYHLSDYYLELVEKEYRKQKKEFSFSLPSITNYLFSDRTRVIGEGRIVDELNPEQFLLLAKGIKIQNLTEQGELIDIPEIIENRKKLIKDYNIDKTILGEKILLNTEYKIAYDSFYTENYPKALEKYNQLLDEINSDKIKTSNKNFEKRKLLKRKSFTLFKLVEREVFDKVKIFQLISDHIQDLKSQFELEKKTCEVINDKKLEKDELSESCFYQINKDWYNFDPLLGLTYFYLAELFLKENNYSIAFKYYGRAYELIKNPSSVEQDFIGLQGDLFTKTERLKLKSNLNSILFRIDEKKEFKETLYESEELATEFYSEEDLIKLEFLSLLKKFQESGNNENLLIELKKLEDRIFNNIYFLYETEDEFIINFFDFYQEVLLKLNQLKKIHSKEEKKLTTIFVKNFLNARVIFEEKKLEGLNQSIREILRKEKINQSMLRQKINRREKFSQEIQNSKQNNLDLKKIFQNIQKFYPEKKRFFQIDEKTKPDKIIENQILIKTKSIKNKFLIHYIKNDNEEDFIFENKENNFENINEFLELKKLNFKNNLTFVFDEKNSELYLKKFNFEEVNFAFLIRQINSVERKNLSFKNKIFQNENIPDEFIIQNNLILEKKSSRKIGASLYDSDILNTEIYYSDGNIFSPSKKGHINFREFTEKNSFLSLIELKNIRLKGLAYFQTLGAVEIIQSARIPIIHLSNSGIKENNYFRIGFGIEIKAVKNTNELKISKNFERIDKNREALEILEKQIFPTQDLEDEIELARLKSKTIPELKKFVFFERLLKKYQNDKNSLFQIYDSLLEECYVLNSNRYCRNHFQNYHNELKNSNLTEKEKKQKLKKVLFLFSANRGVLNLSESEYFKLFRKNNYHDEYLFYEKFVKLFIRNLFLFQAETYAKKLVDLSQNQTEFNKAENYLNQVLIQKNSLSDEKYDLISKENTVYNLGLKKEWSKFEILLNEENPRIYDDSILLFKEKIYLYWKKISTGEYIQIQSLRNTLTSTKKEIYSMLNEVDKKILFLILKKSISKQIDSNLNEILFELIESYSKESKLHKEYMLISYLESLITAHDLKNFFLIHNKYKIDLSLIKNYDLKNRYQSILNKIIFYDSKISLENKLNNEIILKFNEINSKPLNEYYSILNLFVEKNKNRTLDITLKNNFLQLINFCRDKSIHSEEDATEIFLDLSFYLDRLKNQTDEDFKLFKIEKITSEIIKKIPINQKLIILTNSDKETYQFELSRGSKSGDIVLKDNSILISEILEYNQNLINGKLQKNKKDLLDQKIKNLLKLKKNEVNYIYLSDSFFLSPIDYRDEDKLIFVTRPDLLITKKIINLKNYSSKKVELILALEENSPFLNQLKKIEFETKTSENKFYLFDKDISQTNLNFPKINIPFIIGNNSLLKNSFSKNFLQNRLQKLDENFEGLGVINIYQQELESYIHFVKILTEEKDFNLNPIERFQFALKEQKIKYQNENDYLGYRIYSNVFLE